MFLRQLDLTTALRPSLYPDETLLFVQDAVGLYEGKYKIPQYQSGHAYLTSHRACYVDNAEPRKYAVAIDLKDVERPEFYAGFLKSSPKVTLYPKITNRSSTAIRSPIPSQVALNSPVASSPPSRYGSPARPSPAPPRDANATWVCPICSFSNPVPSNFDPATANAHTPLPPCLACGIKPPLVHVVKAAIAAISNRPSGPTSSPLPQQRQSRPTDDIFPPASDGQAKTIVQCPRCTFQNHPSLLSCEICGASLVSAGDRRSQILSDAVQRPDSPGPSLRTSPSLANTDMGLESVKFSFRAGGEKIFYERLKNALIQRKWLLQSAPPVPSPAPQSTNPTSTNIAPDGSPRPDTVRQKTVGIASLELRGLQQRKNNELVIGSAFEDLEALMTSAKEVIAMAERFAAQNNGGNGNASTEANQLLSESASALGLVTTKDMLGTGTSAETTYITELARNLAEFLTDDTRGVLRREGGIMSLVDLWAVFNRTRNGIELISPADFEKAAQMWEQLHLPIRLRRFKSGILVVQGRDRTDEKTVASLLAWLKELHSFPPSTSSGYADGVEDMGVIGWDWRTYGRGVTPQEAAERFGWSVGVASEELEMAEEKGALCREQGLDGIRFWENWIGTQDDVKRKDKLEDVDDELIRERLSEAGFL